MYTYVCVEMSRNGHYTHVPLNLCSNLLGNSDNVLSQLIGPLSEEEGFGSADWNMLFSMESDAYAADLASMVGSLNMRNLSPDDDTASYRSDLVMKVASLLRRLPRKNRLTELPTLSDQHRLVSMVTVLPWVSSVPPYVSVVAFTSFQWIQTCI